MIIILLEAKFHNELEKSTHLSKMAIFLIFMNFSIFFPNLGQVFLKIIVVLS